MRAKIESYPDRSLIIFYDEDGNKVDQYEVKEIIISQGGKDGREGD